MVNDVSNQQLEEIVKELDEGQNSSNAKYYSQRQQAQAVADTARQPDCTERSSGCAFDELKSVLSKVFSLEPFFTPSDVHFEAMCIEQPGNIIGAAGAGYNVSCTFKNSGTIAWPTNV